MDFYEALLAKKLGGEGGGGDVTVEALNVTSNGTYQESGKAYSPVNVQVGYEDQPVKDVNFFDYDGTCLYSYTFDEWANRTELPSPRPHDGLVFDGWFLFDDIEAINNRILNVPNQPVYIFSLYDTSDGKTRLYLDFISDNNAIDFGLGVNGTITIDWGDGSSEETVTGTSTTTRISIPHTYTSRGRYVMSIQVVSGTVNFSGTNGAPWFMQTIGNSTSLVNSTKFQATRSALYKIEFSKNVTVAESAFYNFKRLETVTVPSGLSFGSARTFYGCISFKCMGGAGNGQQKINNAQVEFVCTEVSLSSEAFLGSTIRGVSLGLVTSIPQNCFYTCYSLEKIFIPSTVTSIAATAFYQCSGLTEIHLYPTNPPTLANANAFQSTPSNAVFYVPYSEDHSILEAYQTATNWSTYASQMVEESV